MRPSAAPAVMTILLGFMDRSPFFDDATDTPFDEGRFPSVQEIDASKRSAFVRRTEHPPAACPA